MALSRRVFLKGASAAGVATFCGSSFGEWVGREEEKPNLSISNELHPLTPVPIEQVTIDDEFWAPKRDLWATVTLRDCLRKFERHEGGTFSNFDRVSAGLTGEHAGFPWFDGLAYETIRGAADFLRSHSDPALEAQLDGYIERIAAAASQDADGYVNTYTQLQEPEHRWGLKGGLEVWQHEFYNLGALIEAGVHYCRATGKTVLLDAAVRIANTMSELVGPPPKLNLVPSHELPEEAMLGLYELLVERPELPGELTADADAERYLALAEFWIENRGVSSGKPNWEPDRSKAEEEVRNFDYSLGRPSWGDYAQDHKPVFEQTEIVGHAVRATLMGSAVAALARVNGREEYRNAALRLWENMTYRRMHVTGGVGAYAQEEKFGPDYELPNDAYLETCAAVGAGFFHHNMNLAFGDARFVDELERALYNGVLCGVSLDGDKYTYVNPLVFDERHERWSWHSCPCCPPMFLKFMGAMPGYVYATDADSAYVNLFVGSRATMKIGGTEVAIRQTARYPWDGSVRLSISPSEPSEFGLMLRVPGWCKGASVKVNGETLSIRTRVRGYVRIARKWRKGDVVELSLPMPVEAVRANPKVLANVGRVAIMRGPLVYCVESIDTPGATPTLCHRPEFATVAWPNRLGGVVAVEASAMGDGWNDALYASETVRTSKRRIVAIPYYANLNRGPTKMAVWLPMSLS